ncbi:MAG: DUF2087 domain-containing protein [Rhizonema sp. PD37]|nr:DUF2087 domain-containing protein [Rhizonema sp. PD37]
MNKDVSKNDRLKGIGNKQRLVLEYLALKFEVGITYTEKEVNTLLNQHHLFGDPALLRRELFENGLIDRKRDGSAYWCRESQN